MASTVVTIGSGNVPICESTVDTLSDHPSGKSRALKRVAQKNAAEKTAFEDLQRRLEIERKGKQTEMQKEQRDVREQLLRLKQHKSLLSDAADFDDVNDNDVFTESTSLGCSIFSPGDVIDPYPVTITPRLFKSSSSSRPSTSDPDGKKTNGRQPRRAPSDASDLECPPGRLPPLQTSRLSSISDTTSTSSLGHAESMSSVRSLSPKEQKEFWAGNPQAISSVRRARKTPSQQRFDHQWSRSQSLKERPRKEGASSIMSRSNSVKDKDRPSRLNRLSEGSAWSRTNSLKESRKNMHAKSVEMMSGSLAEIDIVPCSPKGTKSDVWAAAELKKIPGITVEGPLA